MKRTSVFVILTIFAISGCKSNSFFLLTDSSTSVPKITYNKKSQLSLNVNVEHLLTLKDEHKISEYVIVREKNGKQITHLPVNKGLICVFSDLFPSVLELKYKNRDVPVSILIYQVCKILKKDVFQKKDIGNINIEKIAWDQNMFAWVFHFKKNP